MSFAQPWFLLGLLGAAVPVIIHLIHRRKPRKQAFAAIELVIRSVQRVERRWRLRRFLLLAARVLLIAALAIAAARPIWGPDLSAVQQSSGPHRLAIVVDATLSMRAKYAGSSSFSRAITAARNLVDGLGPEDTAVVISATTNPEVAIPRPTADRGRLLAVLDALEPTFAPGDLGQAVTTAVQALGTSTRKREKPAGEGPPFAATVVVLSDLAASSFQSPADLAVPGTTIKARLEVIDVLEGIDPERRRNRAVTEVLAGPVPGQTPRTIEVKARVQSFERERLSDDPDPIDITLLEDDRELAIGSVDIVAGTIVDKVMRHSFESAGFHPLTVVIQPDGLEEDDRRFVRVDVRRQVRMLVVDGAPSGVPKEDEIFYLERALAAGAGDQPPPRIIGADELPRADLSAFDVVILAGVDVFGRQDGARLTQFVEGGGGLLVTTSRSLDAELYNSELDGVLPRPLRGLKQLPPTGTEAETGHSGLAPPEPDDPVTRIFKGEAIGGLRSTRTTAYWLLQPATEPPMSVHLRYDDGQPALVSRAVGAGRVAMLTTSIDRDLTDLAIRPAFVPLMRQLVLYLGRALDTPDLRRTLVRDRRSIRVPEGAQSLTVTSPDGTERRWTGDQLAEATVAFEGTRLPGHYSVSAAFAGSPEPVPSENFVVNLDPRESDLKPLSTDEARAVLLGRADNQPSTPLVAAALGQRIDPDALAALLLMLMALAFVAESALSAFR